MQILAQFIYPFIFVFGLIVGSFLNCVIYRLDSKKTFLSGRSACIKCKHNLSFGDLIPVLGFLFLKGKCRYCKKPISWQYPLVEIATGILFVLIANHKLQTTNYELLNFEVVFHLLFLTLVSCFLIIIFVYDFKHYIILDKVLYPAIGATFLYKLFENWKLEIGNLQPLLNPLFSAFFASAFFLGIFIISRGRWIGFGDVKLGILLGLLLGWPKILTAMFMAYLIGGIISAGLIILKKKGLKSEVPFAPFLITGTFFALFWGEMIFNWYWNLII